MDNDELKVVCKKFGITARKYGGDDAYSWAIFVKGKPVMEGLSKSEVNYYKKSVAMRMMTK